MKMYLRYPVQSQVSRRAPQRNGQHEGGGRGHVDDGAFAALKREVLLRHRGFGCGPDSRLGIYLDVTQEGREIVAQWTASAREEGPPGVAHGGIQATLVDAMAGWATAWTQMVAGLDPLRFPVTTEMSLRFRAPLPIDRPLRLVATPHPLQGSEATSTVALGTEKEARCTVAAVRYRLLDRTWFPRP